MHSMLSYLVVGVVVILETTGQHHIPFGTRTVPMTRNRQLAPPNVPQNIVDPAHRHPKIVNLEAQCFPDGMSLTVDFDSPFTGIVYSKEHFGNPNCRFVQANPAGASQLAFGVPSNDCGTKGNQLSKTLSNVLVFQIDEEVQEIWDIARQVSCSYGNPSGVKNGETHQKMVVFKPLSVGMLDVQHHPIKGEGLDCWMDIQVGKYPNISPIQGQLPIGEELSILIFMKDEERQYDVRVKDCWAFDMEHFEDSKTSKVQLTGYDGCPRKVKLIGPWDKTFDTGDSGATAIAFTNMTAFKFPDSDNVHLSCNIELCRGVCAQDSCGGPLAISDVTDGPVRGTTSPYASPRPTTYQGQGYTTSPPRQGSQNGQGRPATDTNGQGRPATVTNGQGRPTTGTNGQGRPTTGTNGQGRPVAVPAPAGQEDQPICYEGSYDPRCPQPSARNITQELPGSCPPGSLDPECIQFPIGEADQPQDLDQEDQPVQGFAGPDENEGLILGQDYQTTITPPPYSGPYERQPTPSTYSTRPTQTQRAPLCYPGQPDPRCPGSYPTNGNGKPARITVRPTYQTEQTTKRAQTPIPSVYSHAPKESVTARPVLCYPGQIDPRCPRPQPPQEQPNFGLGENEGLIEQEEYYTTTQFPYEEARTTPEPIRTPPRPVVYQTSTKKSDKYEAEEVIGNTYFTTTPKPYQQTTTRIPYQYQTTTRAPYQYQTTNQPISSSVGTYQTTSRIPTTTKKVVCYPGQRDPRCPESYPEQPTRKPGQNGNGIYVQPTQPSALYDFPATGTTLRPYVPSIPPRKNGQEYTTRPQPIKSSTPKPCYRGDPGCAKYATTSTVKYEPEEDSGNAHVSPTTTRVPYQYQTTTNVPYKYQQPSTAAPRRNGYQTTTQNGYPTVSPKQNGYPAATPKQNGYPAATPKQNGYPTASPKQNGHPPATSKQNGYPTATPTQNGYPAATPTQNGYPTTTTAQSGYPTTAPRKNGYPTTTKNGYPTASPAQNGYPTTGQSGYPATNGKKVPPTSPPHGTYQEEEIAHIEFGMEQKGEYTPSAPTQEYPEGQYESQPAGGPSRKPYEAAQPSVYENVREGPSQPQAQDGYFYKPPNGKPFTYDMSTKKPNGYTNGYQGQNGNGYVPTSPGSNGRTTPRPVVCYPGQIDPRCPPVCYEGSTDRRCNNRKRQIDPHQVICFADSTDPRCPKFN